MRISEVKGSASEGHCREPLEANPRLAVTLRWKDAGIHVCKYDRSIEGGSGAADAADTTPRQDWLVCNQWHREFDESFLSRSLPALIRLTNGMLGTICLAAIR